MHKISFSCKLYRLLRKIDELFCDFSYRTVRLLNPDDISIRFKLKQKRLELLPEMFEVAKTNRRIEFQRKGKKSRAEFLSREATTLARAISSAGNRI